MKHLPVAGKAITVLFTAALLVACSGSDTKDEDEAAAAAASASAARAAQEAAAAEAAAKQAQLDEAAAAVGNVFYFDFDSSNLRPDAIEALNAHIAALQGNDRTVRLEGHTDERGTRESNMALGERRANSVRDYMVANGIASFRIESVSYGEERPVAYGSGESNWSQNRRVELKERQRKMQYISKALVAGGLVILTGPLCLMASAQSYVDLEAERAAAGNASSPVSSDTGTGGSSPDTGSPPPATTYGAQPATSYPATSYGTGSAPPATPIGGASAVAASGNQGRGGQNLGNLFYQIQQLQQEVMRLNGKVEEQAHELRVLKDQSLQRYMDLDKRLSGGAAVTSPAAGSGSSAAPAPAAPSSGSKASGQPGEGEAYRAAFALVNGQQFDSAVKAFQQFLRDYPDGKYAANAHYWLGELYLVVEPRDLEASRQSFTLLLSQYPDTNKAPDAMYKLGKVYFDKGNREKAREYMDRVVNEYGSSNSSAVKLARDFIAENY